MEKYIRYKNILLFLGLVLVFIGIKTTLTVWELPKTYRNYQKASEQLKQIEEADKIIASLVQKTEQLQEKIGVYNPSQIPIHKHLDFVAYLESRSREKQARIIALPKEEKMNTSGFQLSKESFSLESGLPNILEVLHSLEWEDRTGSIAYLDLNKRQILSGNSRKEILVADVELQRLVKP